MKKGHEQGLGKLPVAEAGDPPEGEYMYLGCGENGRICRGRCRRLILSEFQGGTGLL